MVGVMTQTENTDAARYKTEAIALAAALHTVLCESSEGEITRTALAALQSTSVGRDYLNANPIRY
jgi:hypothetical protein